MKEIHHEAIILTQSSWIVPCRLDTLGDFWAQLHWVSDETIRIERAYAPRRCEMDLRQLRYFVAVADAGSFSVGAKRAFVTQPTLSAAVSALESELGVRLLERSVRGVVLTAEGTRVLSHARSVLRETELLRSASRQASSSKPIRIGMLPTLPEPLLMTALARLRKVVAERLVQIEEAPAVQLRQRLSSGRYDLLVSTLGKVEPGHRQILVAEDRQILAVAIDRLPEGPVTPKFLEGHPLIVRTHCEQLQAASRILDDWHVRPVIVAKTDSDTRAREMVASGLGACLMPDSFADDRIAKLTVRGVNLSRRLGLEWIRGAADGRFDLNAPLLSEKRP